MKIILYCFHYISRRAVFLPRIILDKKNVKMSNIGINFGLKESTMFNNDALTAIISDYKQNFEQIHKEEIYNMEAIQCNY